VSTQKASQQSVHLTLGILRKSQAVSYAFSFFWLDGFAVPAPAQVTQTVRWLIMNPYTNYVTPVTMGGWTHNQYSELFQPLSLLYLVYGLAK
jgi:hypothetical protein